MEDVKSIATAIVAEVLKQLQPPKVETIVPLAEAAKMLHLQPCTLRKLVYTNKIGYVVDGKSYFFKVSDLNEYINSHYTPSKP